MSDRDTAVERWQLPSFEPPRQPEPPVDPAQEQALARDRGFAQGLEAGRQQGLQEAKQVLDRLVLLLDEMAKPYQNLDQVVTQELLQTAMKIARQILRRELAVDSSLVTAAVAEAMATLSSVEGEIEIHLNPADSAMIRELAREPLNTRSWKLMEDADMLPGGCRLKTPVSYVDASVERQLEMMLSGLIEVCEDTLDS